MDEIAKIIDGKAIAKQIRSGIKKSVEDIEKKTGKRPGLSVVLIGKNEASHIYVNMKEKACKEAGITSNKYVLDEKVSQDEVLRLVKKLNEDKTVHGILVQLPIPAHLDTNLILNSISPAKDVDGIHPVNAGRLSLGEKPLTPCTPAGIIKLIESTGVEMEGAEAVVVGRSNIVGKPISLLLLRNNCTITICHSKTKDLPAVVGRADILIAAIGRPEFIKGEWVKKGAVVIDVGSNRLENGKVVGDVEYEIAKSRASFITPVPGGVGPMTIAMLLSNTLEAFAAIEKEKL